MADSIWTVSPADAGLRLDKYLAAPERLGSRARAFTAIERGKVFVDDREAVPADASHPLAEGQSVRVWIDRPGSSRSRRGPTTFRDLHILFEDDELLVVNKPAGLLTVPLERRTGGSSVLEQLAEYLKPFGKRRPFVVHRIDEDTSGLVVFAKDPRTQAAVQDQFKRREPTRIYLAVVHGAPEPPSGTWRDRLTWDDKALIQKRARGKEGLDAVSEYRVVESLRDTSLLEVQLVTGRRNQIRVQAMLHGVPIVGEKRYRPGTPAVRIPFERYALHAFRLAFAHPSDGRVLELEAPPPADFAALVRRLRRR